MRDQSSFLPAGDTFLAILHSPEDDLPADIHILARGYSSLRRGNAKWVTQVSTSAPPHLAIGKSLVSIPRGPSLTEIYAVRDLVQRTFLKQNPVLFGLFQKVWLLVNPFRIKQISRKVMLAFNESISEKAFGPVPEVLDVRGAAQRDVEIDFKGKSGLTFCEFYDSLFEAIDNHAKSKLVTEYAIVAKRIIKGLHADAWMQGLELHNKNHVQIGRGHQYAPWMYHMVKVTGHIKPKFLSTPSSPSNKSKPLSRALSSKVSQTPSKRSSPARDVFLTQIRALSTVTLKHSPHRRETELSITRPQPLTFDLRVVSKGVRQKLSPISTTHSRGRSPKLPSLIEEVVEKRDHHKFSSTLELITNSKTQY